ncbi:NAD(P)-dependent oxidoreductase [Devriesea agamarum]|uniref:NAD(P)-dependent oxidoreductase n=1 Tax=Devriesea agamarum TaxID=472569 RepID=UPI00071E125E|nr:NAD(P)-binding domain-containing protein [Devriesea agamarum]
MKIAFLGTGKLGTELARHLLRDHDLTVWNRTLERTKPLRDEGATCAATPAEAVAGAEVVVSCLFGPDAVRETIIAPQLIPDGMPWLDATTVSPADGEEFARAVPSYVATPVVGSLGPARAGKLGVYVGGTDPQARKLAAEIVTPWADADRLIVVTDAAEAAVAKLLANLALAVSAQGLTEALTLGRARGLDDARVLDLLAHTGLAFIAGMKRNFVLGEADVRDAHFAVDAIAKDARLMLSTSDRDLPATRAALKSLEAAETRGQGAFDFSVITLPPESTPDADM